MTPCPINPSLSVLGSDLCWLVLSSRYDPRPLRRRRLRRGLLEGASKGGQRGLKPPSRRVLTLLVSRLKPPLKFPFDGTEKGFSKSPFARNEKPPSRSPLREGRVQFLVSREGGLLEGGLQEGGLLKEASRRGASRFS